MMSAAAMRSPWICMGWSAAVAAVMVMFAAPAAAQSSLSDAVIRQLSESRKARETNPDAQAIDLEKFISEIDVGGADDQRRLALRKRAEAFEVARLYDKAEADLTAALAVEPTDASILIDRGYFYMRRGRYADALADFAMGVRREPKNSRFSYAAGRVKSATGDFRAAIMSYDEAIQLNPKDALAFLSRAEARVHLKELNAAKVDYDRALTLGLVRKSDRYFAHFGRGYVRLALQDQVGAIRDFDAVLEIDADAVHAWQWRGVANERRGRADLALADYERAFAIAPDDAWVMASLQRLRAKEPAPAAAGLPRDKGRATATDRAVPPRRPM